MSGRRESAPKVPPSSSSSGPRKNSTEKVSVAENVAKLRLSEDYNMALALQQKEFSTHFDQNRNERRTMGIDHKMTKEEQLAEQKLSAELRLSETAEIARRDEELAKEMQRQLEEEERLSKLTQAQMDEELARRLQLEEHDKNVFGSQVPSVADYMTEDGGFASTNSPSTSFSTSQAAKEQDEEYAKRLQEHYYHRLIRKPHRQLDENTQNEVNIMVDSNVVQTPFTHTLGHANNTSAVLPPLPSYADCVNVSSRRNSENQLSSTCSTNDRRYSNNTINTNHSSPPNTSSMLRVLPNTVTTFSEIEGSLPRERAQQPPLSFISSIAKHPLVVAAKERNGVNEEKATPHIDDLISFGVTPSLEINRNIDGSLFSSNNITGSNGNNPLNVAGDCVLSLEFTSPYCAQDTTNHQKEAVVLELHSTNPFLQDLINLSGASTNQSSAKSTNQTTGDKFGLGTPSNLLLRNDGGSPKPSQNSFNDHQKP